MSHKMDILAGLTLPLATQPASPLSPGSGSDCTPLSVAWEYLADINSADWRPYAPPLARQMNVAYARGLRKCQLTEQWSGHALEIDFARMLETNVESGWQRKIRMLSLPSLPSLLPPPLPQSSAVCSQSETETEPASESQAEQEVAGQGWWRWQWFSAKAGWKGYHARLSDKIEQAHQQRQARYAFKIRSNATQYDIDLCALQQRNHATGKQRRV